MKKIKKTQKKIDDIQKRMFGPYKGQKYITCPLPCENTLFWIVEEGHLCPACGKLLIVNKEEPEKGVIIPREDDREKLKKNMGV